MLEQINALIRDNDICVLATAGEAGPHTSLMAYACSPDCGQIYLVTPRQTAKYRNLCAQPTVSVMVDTRTQATRGEIQALTISGQAVEMTDPVEVAAVRDVFVERHPHLKSLMAVPDIAFIRIVIASLQLLRGPRESHYVQIKAAAILKPQA